MTIDAKDDAIRTRLEQRRYAEAFDLLVAEFGDRMLRLAYSILGDRAWAEDTAQDVLVRIWRALPQFRGDASVSTWVYAITRNRCLTALKRDPRRAELSLDAAAVRQLADRPIEEAPADVGGLDIVALLHELPDNYRQVLMLFYMEEKSYDEIANLLNLPMGTVKTYLHRGRKSLASMVRLRSKREPT